MFVKGLNFKKKIDGWWNVIKNLKWVFYIVLMILMFICFNFILNVMCMIVMMFIGKLVIKILIINRLLKFWLLIDY